jgi:uncharacterized delta-60 repeat protein
VPPPPRTGVNGLAAQRDDRIVAVGTLIDTSNDRPRAVVARYLADGQLDPSFGGGGGFVILALPASESRAYAVALQSRPGGQGILVAGALGDPTRRRARFFITRLLPDGRSDPRFGRRGLTILPNRGRGAMALALTQGGKIAIAGSTAADMAVARIYADGRIDRSFGGGMACIPTPRDLDTPGAFPETDRVFLAAEPSGRLVVAEAFFGPSSDAQTWVLARFKRTVSRSGRCP